MSSRVTRSSARRAADSSAASDSTSTPNPAPPLPPPPQISGRSRKRKAPSQREPSPEDRPPTKASPLRQRKRQKVEAPEPPPPTAPRARRKTGEAPGAMSTPGYNGGPSAENIKTPATGSESSRRKSSRNKKFVQDPGPASVPLASSSSKRSKKAPARKKDDPSVKGTTDAPQGETKQNVEGTTDDDTDPGDTEGHRPYDDDDDVGDDPFRGGYLERPGGTGSVSATLRALSGMVSGVSSRLREINQNLKRKDDPSLQLIALQDLSEILLVSNEDNLSGHFSPDSFVKELVVLMQPAEFGEDNPEMMLLACRCIANLMEALPSATANIVYGGAVPILCQKLLEIHFIDLAEQALSTLEKISIEFPSSIVREGGLTACLTYLDFFATGTQRIAVTTAANCCRNIPEDMLPVIRDVMPILLNVLGSNDQKVVEQGSLCVARIVDSFKYHQDKLEELVSKDLLKAILRLLLPGATNLIGPNIHTQFLRVLGSTARASPQLSTELLKMNVVDTLYQILTGVSPPSGSENLGQQLDSVVTMQALIHRPREQIFETLQIICELLPGVQIEESSIRENLFDVGFAGDDVMAIASSRSLGSPNAKRIELLKDCKDDLKRFTLILLPTLTDAYSSTVNLGIRQKVLTAQLKMLSNLDTSILEEALRAVPYASYLASILSQQDHPTLVTFALQAAGLLLVRLESIYRYQFYREGVITEVKKLANQPIRSASNTNKEIKIDPDAEVGSKATVLKEAAAKTLAEKPAEDEESDGDGEDDDDDDEDEEPEELHDEASLSPTESSSSEAYPVSAPTASFQDYITMRAKRFLETHENSKGKIMRERAVAILSELQKLARDIHQHYFQSQSGNGPTLFRRLSDYFEGDALDSITSSELLNSGIVGILLDVFNNPNAAMSSEARSTFLKVFMGISLKSKSKTSNTEVTATRYSVFVHKLQNLLSRAEHFEVMTVHHNALDSNRSSAASMLAKQLRLKLVADADSKIPESYRNIMVSIHAIATFKALDDYLRPRISLSERPKGARHREGLSSTLAALAAASGMPEVHQRLADRIASARNDTTLIPTPASTTNGSRASRKPSRTKISQGPKTDVAADKTKPAATRRSSRRHQTAQTPVTTPARTAQTNEDPLECADERQISDDDLLDESAALEAIVGDLEEQMENENMPDPGAVNMEVASTGKVTALKEDGSRIATPSQGSQASTSSTQGMAISKIRDLTNMDGTPTLSGRHMSYAAAIQSVPQDWHIEFSIDGNPISNETTIYRAVHYNRSVATEPASRNVWSAIHPVKFRRVPGPSPKGSTSLTPSPESQPENDTSGMPLSLHKHPATSDILRLLNIFHELNAHLDDVLDDKHQAMKLSAEPLGSFVNTKLTAKLNRQLEEPLIVASNCLPSWSEDLARLYPFLFPFETRHLFLQSTSFGYSRSMTRWQNAQSADDNRRDRHRDDRPFLGRLQRQKVRISRTRILESAMKVMEMYGASPSVLEVEYFEEVGTGLGPTLEFYSSVSKEFCKKRIRMWRENESSDQPEYAFGKLGLFPAPMSSEQASSEAGKKTLHLFKVLGKFVARSMLDSRIIDISFNPTFFRIGDKPSTVPLSLGAIKTVDKQLGKSLNDLRQILQSKNKVEANHHIASQRKAQAIRDLSRSVDDLALDFTLPGFPDIELISNGTDVSVTIHNLSTYIEKVTDMTLGSGVQMQVDAFREGFSQVFPYLAMKAFTPNELVMLFGRVEEDWSLEALMDSIKADHGFNMDSRSIRNLLQVMSELDAQQRRDFLQFVTGSPKLPIGGFKSLTPMFTVVCKPSEPPYTSDDYLPSVMTCVNYLKLPDYTSLEVMRERLHTAIREGQGAFHLS